MKRSSARLQEISSIISSASVPDSPPPKSKSKKRMKLAVANNSEGKPEKDLDSIDEIEATNWDLSLSEISGDEPKKHKKKKKKSKRAESEEPPEVKEENSVFWFADDVDVDSKETLESQISAAKEDNEMWPTDKIKTLLQRLKSAIPEGDTLKYSSRITKIDWDMISFDTYSGSDCEKMWKRIQERSRCYRLLEEIIADAETAMQQPSSSLYQRLDMCRYPDRPPKPLSSFMLFFMDKKDKVQQKNPGANGAEVAKGVAELWRDINPRKLKKYKAKAQKLREEYDKKLAKFYEEHPECVMEPKKKRKGRALGFEKPKSAFQLFLSSCREEKVCSEKIDEKQFCEYCKIKWKNMPEQDKVSWIKAAQEEEERYRTNLKKYEDEHPGFVPPAVKTLITKNDRNVLENCKGKPKKPPCNAYSLYSVIMLQSDSLKDIPSKERLAEIARRWKLLEQSDRDEYAIKLAKLQEEYSVKYDEYINSLSPEERMEEEAKNKPSKKKPIQVKIENNLVVPEPEKPPIEVLDLFRSKREHTWKKKAREDPVEFAQKKWEKLPKAQKESYIRELKNLNEEYYENFGKFLQQCSPDKITQYLNSIVQHKREFQDALRKYAEFDVNDNESSRDSEV